MQRKPDDFLSTLAASAADTVSSGYYLRVGERAGAHVSLSKAIRGSRAPLVCEVKFVSPAEGRLRPDSDVAQLARSYESGGAAAISVITEPKHFGGRLEYLPLVKRSVRVPVMMKDVVVDPIQVDAAARLGADAVLLIAGIFHRGFAAHGVDEMTRLAHSSGLEVILEVHSGEEYAAAIKSDADIVGINNRNLDTLEVSLETTREILSRYPHPKPVISESGLKRREDIESLHNLGADAFLVGSALMKSQDASSTVRSLLGE
ncbi:MAG: indole-3-glycerol-phosphate synthase [Nitrososphaerota archaeon]|nr:indole-3-glycerol-phosphate synthase [Nitrososphaerota archaeon]